MKREIVFAFAYRVIAEYFHVRVVVDVYRQVAAAAPLDYVAAVAVHYYLRFNVGSGFDEQVYIDFRVDVVFTCQSSQSLETASSVFILFLDGILVDERYEFVVSCRTVTAYGYGKVTARIGTGIDNYVHLFLVSGNDCASCGKDAPVKFGKVGGSGIHYLAVVHSQVYPIVEILEIRMVYFAADRPFVPVFVIQGYVIEYD